MESQSKRPTGHNGPTAKNQKTAPGSDTDGCRASGAGSGRIGVEQGTPPSNTVPYTCNLESFRPLRWGVDSVYLSYQGELNPEAISRLKALKELAQEAEDHKKALAQYPFEGHIFEVKDKGAKHFPYILEDGAFRIQLSKGKHVPMAYVKVSAAFLAHVGPQEAERRLYAILVQLGTLSSSAQVSRIDLFCDFAWDGSMEWPREAWITRAKGKNTYSVDDIFTGWVIGEGGAMSARLYNKTIQAKKIGAEYVFDLWRECGWNGFDPVWRLEFEIKREVLAQMGIAPLSRTLSNLNGLWSYATTEWLKLAIPQEADKTRSRWPIHPLWGLLSSIDWETPGGPLLRSHNPARVPADERLYGMYLSALIGFMAKRGIQDLYQAQEEMIAYVVSYFTGKAYEQRLQSFDDFIADRLALKVRQFNTGINAPDGLADIDQSETEERAKAYRKAKGD